MLVYFAKVQQVLTLDMLANPGSSEAWWINPEGCWINREECWIKRRDEPLAADSLLLFKSTNQTHTLSFGS